jgi:hypothetical protein
LLADFMNFIGGSKWCRKRTGHWDAEHDRWPQQPWK